MFASAPASRMARRAMLMMLGVVACTALALTPAVSASAHDYLIESSPAANSEQTSPISQVSLTFDDRVLDFTGDGSSAIVEVVGPNGMHYETGCSTILDRTVTVPVALGNSGKYTVTWRIVSADGHPVSNSIVFNYAPPAGTVAMAGQPNRPQCGSGAFVTAPPTATATTSAPSGGVPIGVWIGLGIAVLAVISIMLGISIGRRGNRARPKGSEDWPTVDD